MCPGGLGTSCIIDSAVTLLPEPDSPTMASVSPSSRSKLVLSTALIILVLSTLNWVVRCLTSSSFAMWRLLYLSLGSSASRRPSPSRLKDRTVSAIAMPGKVMIWFAENI